jgi:CBS domain-containing protein
MKVRDVMTTDIKSAQLDTTIEEIATMMRDGDVGAVPVLDDGELCGILTDRDIVVRCIAEGNDPAETTVEDILSEDLKTVSPNQNTEEAARLMAELQVRRLPVVEKGELVGMVSIGDLAVKSDTDEDRIGRTLEEVSEGVKASGRDAQRASRSGIPANTGRNSGQLRQNSNARQNANARQNSRQQRGIKRQQPGSATQMTERNAGQVRGRKPAGVAGGGRQQTIEAESGRYSRSTRGRIEAEQGRPPRSQKSSGQGIGNRSAKQEMERQSRVVKMSERGSRSQKRKAS